MIVHWVAFAGGSCLWEGERPDEIALGDMCGPFGSWTAAATWVLAAFPLSGDLAAQRETLDWLVRPVLHPGTFGALRGVEDVPSAGGLQLAQAAMDAEKDVFWQDRAAK